MATTISKISSPLKHHAPIRNVSWLPDSRHLFSGDDHGMVLLSTALTAESTHAFKVHPTSISALKTSPHGKLLATAAVDGVVRVWTYGNPLDPTMQLHLIGEAKFEGEVAGLEFRPRHDATLGIADASGAISLWNPLSGDGRELIAKLPMQANSTAWSPEGRFLAVGCDDFAVHLIDLEGGPTRQFHGHTHHADQLGYSRCGGYIASGSHDRSVRVWAAATGECLQVLKHDLDTVKPDWSGDGRLVTCSYDQKLRVWNPLTGELLAVLDGHTYDVDDVAWSPDFRYIASCGWDNRVIPGACQ